MRVVSGLSKDLIFTPAAGTVSRPYRLMRCICGALRRQREKISGLAWRLTRLQDVAKDNDSKPYENK